MSGSRTIGAFVEDETESDGGNNEAGTKFAMGRPHLENEPENFANAQDSQEQPLPVPRRSINLDTELQYVLQKPIASLTTAELELAVAHEQTTKTLESLNTGLSAPSPSETNRQSAIQEANKAIKEQFEASQTECEILRNQVLELQKNLHDAQDFIFSLQPRQQRITESEAAVEFHSLCGSVEEWVQTKLGDALEDMTLSKERGPLGQPAKVLLSLISQPGREAFRCPETDEYNIIAVVMRFICNRILDKDFYCPIEKGGMEFLNTIEKSMRSLEPRRDLISCRTWRSETYVALANRHEFVNDHNKLRDSCTLDLTTLLRIFIPRADKQMLMSSIRSAIIDPALSLAYKLHLSVDKYSIYWTPHHALKFEDRRSTPQELSNFECVDLLSGRTVKFPTKGRILTYMFDMSPGLMLETVKADFYAEPKVLKKPRILVAATKEESGPYNPPLPRLGDPATLLGWLDESIHPRHNSIFRRG